MLAVFEGPDGSGKTTLAETLAGQLGCDVLHHGPPHGDPLIEYLVAIKDYVPGRGQHLVIDRLHWGEMVYGPLLRGESALEAAGWLYIELALRARGALICVPDLPTELLEKRLAERGDDLIHAEQLSSIGESYRSLTARSIAWVQPITEEDVDRGPEATCEALQLRGATFEGSAADGVGAVLPGYVGSPRPEVVLVGDQPGDPNTILGPVPFAPTRTGSGRWLMNAVPTWMAATVGLVNACDDPSRIAKLTVAGAREARWVALGREADRTLTDLGVGHGSVPHPQYARRFHHRAVAHYAEALTLAAQHHVKIPKEALRAR